MTVSVINRQNQMTRATTTSAQLWRAVGHSYPSQLAFMIALFATSATIQNKKKKKKNTTIIFYSNASMRQWRLIQSRTLQPLTIGLLSNYFDLLLLVILASDLPVRTTIKCCSVVFGVTLRLLIVINTSSSSQANNKRRPLPAMSVTDLPRSGGGAVAALTMRWNQILVENRNFCLPTCIRRRR